MHMPIKPMFVSIEGAEGSGKSTMTDYFCQALSRRMGPCVTTHAPGGSPVGADIRAILKKTYSQGKLTSAAQLLLFIADRLQHINTTILPELKAGVSVVSDRYLDSTEVLQCAVGGQSQLYAHLTQDPSIQHVCVRPDYTLFFSVHPDTASRRLKKRGGVTEEMDTAYSRYSTVMQWQKHFQALKQPYWSDRIYVINADPPGMNTPEESMACVRDQLDNAALSISGHWLSTRGYAHYCYLDRLVSMAVDDRSWLEQATSTPT